MQLEPIDTEVLKALFRCSREGHAGSMAVLAAVAGRSWQEVSCALERLQQQGLTVPGSARLTFAGVAVASALLRPPVRRYRPRRLAA